MKRKKEKLPKAVKRKSPDIRDGKVKYIWRGAVMVLIIGFALLGVYYATHYEDSHKIISKMGKYKTTLDAETAEQRKAESFASNFVATYYSYNEHESERYAKEVARYTAKELTLNAPTAYSSQVIAANAETITKVSRGFDVTVRVTIQWKVPVGNDDSNYEDGIEYKKAVRECYILVPVGVKDGNYAIISQPTYVADPNKATEVKKLEDTNSTVGDKLTYDIKSLAANFLKAYCGDSKSQLRYFVSKDFSTNAIDSGLRFKDITTINIMQDGDKYIADVQYTVTMDGIEQTQRLFLTIVHSDKYYVERISTR